MSRRSRRASARSAGGERTVIALVGLLCLGAGMIGALVGFGVFGTGRSHRPLLDPVALALLRTYPITAGLTAVAAGSLLAILGLCWLARSLRPQTRPDLILDTSGSTTLRVTAAAAAVTAAITDDTQRLAGVGRAATRVVGSAAAPALRMTLWLTDGADVATIWRDIDQSVLAPARTALGIESLPTAIRLELHRSTARTRVH